MRKKAMCGLSCIIVLLFCLCVALSANAASAEEDVLQLEKNWIKAAEALDLELLSSLYWRSSKTTQFSPNKTLAQGLDAITEGMKEFFSPGTLHASHWAIDDKTQVIMLSDNVAIITGYHYLVNVDSQKESQHRFTRVVQKIGGKWLIVHDHESDLPPVNWTTQGAPKS